MPRHLARIVVAYGLAALVASCASGGRRPPPPPPPAPEQLPPAPLEAEVPEAPVAPAAPLPALPPAEVEEPLEVMAAPEPTVVAAWAEPQHLPAGGGQAQVLVRVQSRGGRRMAGVEVRLRTSEGSLFSAGRLLVTDAQGMTRDRLTTRKSATITLNAGGTLYRLEVPVDEPSP